jgi:hypothetical protein
MNPMIRSRVNGIGVGLLHDSALMGCACEQCFSICTDTDSLIFRLPCVAVCTSIYSPTEVSQAHTENPNRRASTFAQQRQIEAIEFCKAYPQECQAAFDAYLESFEGENLG